jgi:hypothetical protein
MKIKENRTEEYKKYTDNNKDPYGKCVVDCSEIMGNFIDEGKSFTEAEELMSKTPDGNELTGFLMGCVISGLVHFHPQGDEIRKWWNDKEKYGTPDENGVKNPAILTLKA